MNPSAERNYSSKNSNIVEDTLKNRQSAYGSYDKGTEFRATVMAAIRKRHVEEHSKPMDSVHEMMIWDLVNKLSRLAVSPDHIDTVHDIAGYATLYEKYLRSNNAKGR